VKGLSPPALLDTYNEERLPVISEMLNRTTSLMDKSRKMDMAKLDVDDPNSAWRRGGELMQLGVNYRWSSIILNEVSEAQAVGSYPEAPKNAYSAGSDGGVVKAGDRAPDAPALVVLAAKEGEKGEMTRLFDIFKPHRHTVLIFLGEGAAMETTVAPVFDALDIYPAGLVATIVITRSPVDDYSAATHAYLVAHDKDGHAVKGYGVPSGPGMVVVIVRPDGVVGAIVQGTEGIAKYFGCIFS
jgi:hypothetical protein